MVKRSIENILGLGNYSRRFSDKRFYHVGIRGGKKVSDVVG